MTAPPAGALEACLAERLRKRAVIEREIAANSARVFELLKPELALFEARAGHNIYATRMAIEHRDNAKKDAEFADDLDAAADALLAALRLREAAERLMAADREFYEAKRLSGIGYSSCREDRLALDRFNEAKESRRIARDDLARVLEEGE